MKTIEQLLFEPRELKQDKEEEDAGAKTDEPKAKKFKNDIIRKDQKELYQLYVTNPIVFNTVNKYVQLMMAPGFEFKSKDPTIAEWFNDFYDGIGELGSETDKYDLMADTLRHQLIGGRAWQENIYNKAGTKIVDLDIINPLSMDYAKDFSGKIVLDDMMNPVGYVQTIPVTENVDFEQKFEVPQGVSISTGKLFLPRERVTHFKLYKVGDGFDGLGIVEPIYNSSLRKLNSEKGFSDSASRLGSPIISASIGDQLHEPTPQQIENTLTEISNVNQKSAIAYPYTTKVSLLDPRKPEKLKEYLDYFEAVEITGMGMPAAFSSGQGQATNRSTLNRQEYIMKLTLKEMIRKTCRTIEQKQLKVIAEQQGFKEYPRIVWGEISLEELDSKSKRLVAYAGAGLLKPSPKLEQLIRELEKLPKEE